jgi:LmbE family N-acetylglucosaminyl deacetylase
MNNPNVVLALMAHPDDAEFLCAGTLALLKNAGWEVHIATATAGDCGSSTLKPEEISAIRRKEAAAAAAVLGGNHYCLEQLDLLVRYDRDALTAACGVLREVRPRILIVHSPVDYNVDHEQISLVGRAAAFAAPVPNAAAPPGSVPLDAVPHLYYADPVEAKDTYGETVTPGLLINIETTLDTKLEMVACHASQREWLRNHHDIDEYLEIARRWSENRGVLACCKAAEGFRQHLGHGYPQDDLLGETLMDQVRKPSGS